MLEEERRRREDELVAVTRLQEGHANLEARIDNHTVEFTHVWTDIKQLRDRLPFMPVVMASLTMSGMTAAIGYLIKWVEVLR